MADHPVFQLGKEPAKRDRRNLQLRAILKAPVALPLEYDFDTAHPAVPMPMFANDQYGDCVIAGRAHQTLRFELLEQKKLISIKDSDVTREYFKESGGQDSGLYVLDSLNTWRHDGWIAGRRRYFITAFAEINRKSRTEVKRAVFTDLGAGLGLSLPLSAQDEINAGKPWTATSGRPGGWGGHYVYVCGYTKLGPTCVTWGRKQQMSWAFFAKYCDEAYTIIDDVNTRKKQQAIDSGKLQNFLETLP